MAILMRQLQFVGDEGRPVLVSLDELVEMHLGGRTSIRVGLDELECAGMLRRENRSGGKGRPASYQIVGDPASWLAEGDVAKAGLGEPCSKVPPHDTFRPPHGTFEAPKVPPHDTPIKTSNRKSTASSKKGGPSSALPPSTPSASGPTSDVVPAVANEKMLEIEDVWTPPPTWPIPSRVRS